MQSAISDVFSGEEVQWQLTVSRFDEWMRNDVFHLQWWFLLVLFIISAYFWWKTLDKSRLNEIVLYTSIITIITLILDELGEELTLWDYPYDLFPLFPPLTAIDLASLPMVYSLIYQYFGTWKKFITATIIMAAIFCFILEPLFVLGGIYQMLKWKSYFGFPIYIFMAIGTKVLVNIIYSVSSKSQG
ncbi:MAG: hypothetical protein FIA99_11465 [Ruminiclostridium sp.]|nr:hypothetical protein [Ruminiclostridium sp.]